jgi:predicted lysophospholipase L1 biosynthesis ABC-type transport system permease subunit
MYLELADRNRTLTDLFAFAPIGNVNVVVNGHAEIASAFLSTGNYYRALQETARLRRVASIGLFGLMSYSVVRRTNEIGIRMALGAERQDVVRLVMRESMMLVVAGVLLGLTGAIAATRLVANLIFGLAPLDPITMTGAVVVMVFFAALAGYVPARRASRIDPMVALRYE